MRLVLPAAAEASGTPAPQVIELWSQGAPGAHGDSIEDRPVVAAYLPAPDVATGAGIMLFPGGGFVRRCEDHEGVLAAEWLRAHGIAAFMVRYRVVPIGTLQDAFDDAHRAVQLVRSRASHFAVSPRRLGALGFSAGATLAANVALSPRAARTDAADPIERVASRPDFLVLAYGDANQRNPGARGLVATGLTAEQAARLIAPSAESLAAAPPAFLYGTSEDAGAARGLADLYARLLAAGRPVEAHFFGFGEHGTGFALGDPNLGVWPGLMQAWMRTSGFLTDAPRVALRGSVKIDGQPLPRGSVVLSPLGDPGAPAVVAYVFGTGELPGDFLIPAERGPTPGRYRVEVRQDARRWSSNARDAVYIRMQARQREAGALDARDLEEWVASARGKDFSASVEQQIVYTRRAPTDGQEWILEIVAGRENRLDLAVVTK